MQEKDHRPQKKPQSVPKMATKVGVAMAPFNPHAANVAAEALALKDLQRMSQSRNEEMARDGWVKGKPNGRRIES